MERPVVNAGRDAMAAGRDLTINKVFQGELPTAARSAYLEQVRRIAPPDPPGLRDRDAELSELAWFCLDPDGASYAWWRAGPWAGKSALLSTFVLLPPVEVAGRVRIVSFFITARLVAQDTRDAFTQVLAEQLAAMLGQSLPTVLPEATREAYLLDLMAQAARECREAGGRLVLVVDGLDEDQGVTTGPDAHSIAGMLPASPPAGMRVIVAGRPNPPVPSDVPDFHPLRDPAIVRPLAASQHARDVQRLGRQELQRLLHGSTAEQDVLGLLAAARGGLTGPDLAELAEIPLWVAEDILHTAAGRTFSSRPNLASPGDRRDVYLLAHEELQAAATEYFRGRLDAYRERLHAWAGDYRARRWPAGTPEYLLAGYFRFLDNTGDLPQMIECALDGARHDRMLSLTGGDAAALDEIRTTLDRVAADHSPDLASALALACHRDHLADRNANIPVSLPTVWATLGQLPRAQALAASITSPYSQVNALVGIMAALAHAGHEQRAAEIATRAEQAARAITNPATQAEALAGIAEGLAQAGHEQAAADIATSAEQIARAITNPDQQGRTLGGIAVTLAQAGYHQRATGIARVITDPDQQARTLTGIAAALAQAGLQRDAADIATSAEHAARAITNPAMQANALANVATVLVQAGLQQDAADIATSAGHIARAITNPAAQANALADIATALALAGRRQDAADIATSAGHIARAIAIPAARARARAAIAAALAQAGHYEHATDIARSITNPYFRADALASIATTMAQTSEASSAARIAAATCAAGPWTAAVRPVLLLMPSAFTTLRRVLEEY